MSAELTHERDVAVRLAQQLVVLVDDIGGYTDDPNYLDVETRNLLHRIATRDPRALEDRGEAIVPWLLDPETWERTAALITSDHTYDLDDDSHRLDVVQIVCEALAKQADAPWAEGIA